MRTSRLTTMLVPGTVESTLPHSDRLATLERRLNDGYDRIEQALVKGEDVSHWEEFWIDLLHQYESALAPLEAAA